MSDYLGHLLERSFAPTPEVRPLVPSLFEPKPAGEQTTLRFSSLEDDRAAAGKNPQTHASADRKENMQPPRSEESGRLGGIGEKIGTPGKNIEGRNHRSPSTGTKIVTEPMNKAELAPPRLMSTDAFHSHEPDRSAGTDSAQSSSRKEFLKPASFKTHPDEKHNEHITSEFPTGLPKAASKVVVDFSVRRAQDPEPVAGHIDDSERRYGDRRPPQITQNLQPRAEPILPSVTAPVPPAKTAAALPLSVGSSREKNSNRREVAAASTAAVPPSIHVTIGRVEIRATPPPAATRAAPRKESGMSLENYLQRRAGGQS